MVESWDFEYRHKIVDKLARRHFNEKVIAAVLDADVG